MVQRRYGPVKGAGTTVTELEGPKQIISGALGYCAYAGMFEKGPVGEMVIATTAKEFNAQMGSYYDGALAADACEDFFSVAAGAGGLALVRVTDGNEVAAQATLWNRNGDVRESMGVLKAKNGGKWGGKALKYRGEISGGAVAGLTELTLDTGEASLFATDELKGGYIELDDVESTQYEIASNTSAGVVTVLDGLTMKTDYGAGTDDSFYIVLGNDDKEVTFLVGDGEDSPSTEFSLSVFVDAVEVRRWANLSTDPASPKYWVSAVNDDQRNYYVEAVDGWAGKAHTPGARPSNHFAKIPATGITATTIDITGSVATATSIMDGKVGFSVAGSFVSVDPGTTTDEMVEQTLTLTYLLSGNFDVSSDVFGVVALDQVEGLAIDPDNKFVPAFTVTSTSMDEDETIILHYKPFVPDQLIGGFVYPDKVNSPSKKFRIVDNDHSTLTIATGFDMTAYGDDFDYFLVEKPQPLSGGRDGNADVVDADFILQAWDVDTSPFNKLFGKNLGLVKMATPAWDGFPGLTSAIDIAGLAYAEAKNYEYRIEFPEATVAEDDANAHINDTIGRSDFLVASFPSWGYVADPQAPGQNKLKKVSLTGKIQGRESRIAENFQGYHKAAAGIDATLPGVLKLTTGTALLDEELLNPTGISVIKLKNNNFVIWGDRICYEDSNWMWKHQREQMSHYEHVLQENFDFIIFAINDPQNDAIALLTLQEFFLPEWQAKRALRGSSFAEAAIFKLDDENNTDATRATGDLNVEIQLKLADTVERFNIFIGKQGIFESVG